MAYADPNVSARATPAITHYARTSAQLGDLRARLTTGNRTLRIGDDVASITTAAYLQAQHSTLRGSLVNSAKATSFLAIATEGLSHIKSVLETLSALTATANDSGRTPLQLKTLDAQFQAGLLDIDAIVAATSYEGVSLLDGSAASPTAPSIPVGNTSGDTISLDIPDVSAATLFPVATNLASSAAATTATTNVATAQASVEDAIAKVDAAQLRLTTASAAVNQTISGVNLSLEDLLGTDTIRTARAEEVLRIRQNTAAALLAQTFGLNSGLLDLLAAG